VTDVETECHSRFNVVHSHTALLMRDEQENGDGRGNVLITFLPSPVFAQSQSEFLPSPFSCVL